jgi:hypothetical protein
VKVLVVDDERLVLDLAVEILHRSVDAPDGVSPRGMRSSSWSASRSISSPATSSCPR